jgi:glycopeptide antibiotics resistance protein
VKHEINLNPFAILVSLFRDSFFYIVVNHIGNIILFMPLGYMLSVKWPHLTTQKILLIGCLASLSIELTQLLIPNRCTDIDDIILNTLGTWLGGARVARCQGDGSSGYPFKTN